MRRRTLLGAATVSTLGILTGCSAPDDLLVPPPSSPASSPPSAATGTAAPAWEAAAADIEAYVAARPDDFRRLRAIVVRHRGEQVLERYWQSSADEHAHIWSVTKSVVSLLTGIAIADGAIDSVDQTLAELLPKHRTAMKKPVPSVTLRQLLTMSGGVPTVGGGAFNDAGFGSVDGLLAAGTVTKPGTTFAYGNGGAHLVGAVVATAVGESLLDYARRTLFEPLDIDTRPAYTGRMSMSADSDFGRAGFAWPVDDDGLHLGHAGLRLTATDMARIGQLCLDDGRWQGRRLVPASWIAESTRDQASGLKDALRYGYLWNCLELASADDFQALGAGGQAIGVTPELELAVSVSSRPDVLLTDVDVSEIYTDIIAATARSAR